MKTPTKQQLLDLVTRHPEDIENIIQAFEDETVEYLPYHTVKRLLAVGLYSDEDANEVDRLRNVIESASLSLEFYNSEGKGLLVDTKLMLKQALMPKP